MKGYDKDKLSSYSKYQDVNNLYGWAMSQNLTVNRFKWVKEISQFNKGFIEIIQFTQVYQYQNSIKQ